MTSTSTSTSTANGESPAGGRFAVGDRFPLHRLAALPTVGGPTERPVQPGALTHVQLRRFAGCPICNLHLRSVSRRLDEITAAGVQEVVVFHSTVEELTRYQDELPFTVVADPSRTLYRAVGVEASVRAVLDPRFWRSLPAVLKQALHEIRTGGIPLRPTGGDLGRPADFLLDHEGRILAVHYGAHAADQWTVDQLLGHAGQHRGA